MNLIKNFILVWWLSIALFWLFIKDIKPPKPTYAREKVRVEASYLHLNEGILTELKTKPIYETVPDIKPEEKGKTQLFELPRIEDFNF